MAPRLRRHNQQHRLQIVPSQPSPYAHGHRIPEELSLVTKEAVEAYPKMSFAVVPAPRDPGRPEDISSH